MVKICQMPQMGQVREAVKSTQLSLDISQYFTVLSILKNLSNFVKILKICHVSSPNSNLI